MTAFLRRRGSQRPTHAARGGQVDFADLPPVWRWMKETARQDPEGFLWLTGGYPEPLQQVFGPAHWRQDGEEGWLLAEQGVTLAVLRRRGATRYHARLGTGGGDVSAACIGLLRRLLATLPSTTHPLHTDT